MGVPPCNNGSAAVSKRMGGQKIRLIIILSFYSHSFFLPFPLSFFLSFPIPHAFYGRRDFIARSNILLRVVIIFAASGKLVGPPLGVTASRRGPHDFVRSQRSSLRHSVLTSLLVRGSEREGARAMMAAAKCVCSEKGTDGPAIPFRSRMRGLSPVSRANKVNLSLGERCRITRGQTRPSRRRPLWTARVNIVTAAYVCPSARRPPDRLPPARPPTPLPPHIVRHLKHVRNL